MAENNEYVIDEITFKMMHEKYRLWEEKLKLHLKPKPKWLPIKIWSKLVNLVVFESSQKTI